MHRRDFLKYMAALGLVSGAGRLVLPEEVWAMAPLATPQPLVAKVQGANYAQITGDAIRALGGMKKFVNPGEVVVVKPNMAWDRTPEYGRQRQSRGGAPGGRNVPGGRGQKSQGAGQHLPRRP